MKYHISLHPQLLQGYVCFTCLYFGVYIQTSVSVHSHKFLFSILLVI